MASLEPDCSLKNEDGEGDQTSDPETKQMNILKQEYQKLKVFLIFYWGFSSWDFGNILVYRDSAEL